jgi:hypothetical protein
VVAPQSTRSAGNYPFSHFDGNFGLVCLSQLGHEVQVLDHFIVGRTSTMSFAERGLL